MSWPLAKSTIEFVGEPHACFKKGQTFEVLKILYNEELEEKHIEIKCMCAGRPMYAISESEFSNYFMCVQSITPEECFE